MSTPLLYSYRFGQEVVQAFTEKYTRATYFVARMLDISYEDLCARLIYQVRCANQLKWEASKHVIKKCKYEDFRQYKQIPPKERRKYMQIALTNAIHYTIDLNSAQNAIDKQEPLDYT